MKIKNIVTGSALVVALIISGCSTLGMDRSEKARTTMADVEKDIQELVAQVTITDESLQELINPNQTNAKKQFKIYSKNVKKTDKKGEQLLSQAEEMSTQGKEYFEEWRSDGKSYNNQQIQSLSEQRRAELSADFVRISEASIGVRGSIKSYLSNHKEIQSYLSNDLTPAGIASITPVAEKSMQDGAEIKEAVKPILSAIGNAKQKMKTSGTN